MNRDVENTDRFLDSLKDSLQDWEADFSPDEMMQDWSGEAADRTRATTLARWKTLVGRGPQSFSWYSLLSSDNSIVSQNHLSGVSP